MKAGLSSEALAGLTTREGSDPSIALLDAWAVVADVLTFYQERIANEGYLRTATERRSVLGLARLVGYAPRPGVASSVYLAYTLEEKPKPVSPPGSPAAPVSASQDEPEIVIPTGARAQSVPGPGETQQPFETSDDLTARAAWNKLQVRLTRPQQPELFDGKKREKPIPLYLLGIATNLKPNDPLLIEAGSDPLLYRVMEVTPDAALGRTQVGIQPWWTPPPPPPTPLQPLTAEALPESQPLAEVLRGVVDRSSDLAALGISAGPTAQGVLSHLEPLKAALAAGAGEATLRSTVEEALPKLKGERATAESRRATRVSPWVAGLTAELEETLATQGGAGLAASAAGPAPIPLEELAADVHLQAKTTALPDVLKSLGKPPTQPPSSSLRLERDAGTLLASGSDLSARLLAVARPELRDVLYKAWANVPVALPPTLKVCALRTRASVFGHNSPLELVRRPSDGVILRTKEWDLVPPGGTVGETITIALSPSFDSPAFNVGLHLQISGQAAIDRSVSFNAPNQTRQFAAGDETVQVTALAIPTSSTGDLSFNLDFYFKNRDVHAAIAANQPSGQMEVYKVTGSGLRTRTVVVERSQPPGPAILAAGESRSIEVEEAIDTGAGEPEKANVVFLDNSYPQIQPSGWIVLERPDSNLKETPLVIARAMAVKDISRAAYGSTGKSTRVELSSPWLQFGGQHPDTFAVVRGTAVYAQCEELALAEMPIEKPVCEATIELAAVYDGLQPGRWLIFSGERTNVGKLDDKGEVSVPVPGVPVAELVMLADVDQGTLQREAKGSTKEKPKLEIVPGERTHTTLTLATPLAYCYKRDTLTIYGNVARATHGQTRSEVLGSGNASKALQSFTLKQPPLTWISAPTPSGIDSTLNVRVNDVRWHLAGSLAEMGPADRSYILRTDDGGQTTVVFGNGGRGARLPTGAENVRAVYRSGIGRAGNVKAGQISQLATRPLGVKDVINPLPATGGADPESRDQARGNAPLALLALDRLISDQDYEDFTRTFAGVGKASAVRLSNGRVQLVHVTIAGEDDIPIGTDSDLLKNLETALRQFGDPRQPLRIEGRRRTFLVVQAEVKLLPDYLWEAVEPKVRAAMLDAFGFARRDLGQDALLSEVYATIQGVLGVDLVDVSLFARKDPEDVSSGLDKGKPLVEGLPAPRLQAHLAQVDDKGKIQPAQLLYLTPEVADTLILKERKS